MSHLTRRHALQALAALATTAALPGVRAESATPGARPAPAANARRRAEKMPLVHITDLYHPPQDPDDHLDLLTIAALPEFEVRGVVLDATRRFLLNRPEGWDIPRDPGYVPVAQLGYLTGRAIPVGLGPLDPLGHPGDTARDRPRPEQAGIELLLEVLERSSRPVTISVVGSARVLAAAYNREPRLLRERTRVVLLNAGATGGVKREWNVGLDPAAYVAVWRSGLPIDWYPCATDRSAFDPADERGTFWKAPQAQIFRDLPESLRAWLCYAFTGNGRGDIIRALAETGRGDAWNEILAGERNLWATVSLVMAAGRVLARTDGGWRFLSPAEAAGRESWPFQLDPIRATVDDDAHVGWAAVSSATPVRLFARRPGADYGIAMAEAFNALLRSFPA
ncbi:MAG TPA: hypothetical protein VHE61_19585 [Opitutaceae bacterium]|nr:hypothetical protein [Opitutaceae bacterium]